MRLKHNKKRNTAFVYEALVRELTKSIIKKNRNKQNKIVSIMKEHFSSDSALFKELNLYKAIYETENIDKRLAEKVILEAKMEYSSLNKKRLFQEQSSLINKINKTLSNKMFANFVPNYKSIASVYSIFQEALPVKDRVLLEESIIERMSSQKEEAKVDGKREHIDNIVYKTFVDKFNEEYSTALTERQKNLLGMYISSFADNGIELKAYLNEEIGTLQDELQEIRSTVIVEEDEALAQKIEKLHSILKNPENNKVGTQLLETVLKTQSLIEEMKQQ